MTKVCDLRERAAPSTRTGVRPRFFAGRFRVWIHSGDEGQSLVEFALVLPLMMMVLTAIFMIGIVMLNWQTLTQAQNQGAITLQQLPSMPGSSDPCSAVATAVMGAAGTLQTTGANGIQLTVQMGSYTSPTQSVSTATCQGGASYAQQGATGIVTLTYPCNIAIYGYQFSSSCQLNASTQELMQ